MGSQTPPFIDLCAENARRTHLRRPVPSKDEVERNIGRLRALARFGRMPAGRRPQTH